MKAKFIPVMLNTSGREVVVFGGGKEAFRKAKLLVGNCEKITVVSTDFIPEFSKLDIRKIKPDIMNEEDIKPLINKSSIVIIAADDSGLRQKLQEICIEMGILYNEVDEINSPIVFPATYEDSGVTISVSTSGKSPAFSKFLRDALGNMAKPYTIALPVIEELRKRVRPFSYHEKVEYFQKLFHTDRFWESIKEEKTKEAYAIGCELIEAEKLKK